MQRNIVFDIARAVCIIWIVCFWHMNGMIIFSQRFFDLSESPNVLYVTNGVLACFTFISGFFLSKKVIKTPKDIFNFYKKRFSRFYIPLLITCLFFYIGGWLSTIQVGSTLCGFAQLLPPPYPKTVWYLSMLILFYILTPFILFLNKTSYKIYTTVFIYVLILMYHIFIQPVDERLLLYYWFYFIPFYCQLNKLSLLIIGILSLCISLGLPALLDKDFIMYDMIIRIGISMLILMLIFFISWCIYRVNFMNKFLSLVAYSSMFAYLFHREIFVLFKFLCNTEFIHIYYVPLLWVFVFLFSYMAQKLYDNVLNKLTL